MKAVEDFPFWYIMSQSAVWSFAAGTSEQNCFCWLWLIKCHMLILFSNLNKWQSIRAKHTKPSSFLFKQAPVLFYIFYEEVVTLHVPDASCIAISVAYIGEHFIDGSVLCALFQFVSKKAFTRRGVLSRLKPLSTTFFKPRANLLEIFTEVL